MRTYDVLFWIKSARFSQAEGLVVLLSDLIKGLNSIDVRVRIFASARHEPSLRFCFDQNNVPQGAYEICGFCVSPAVLTVLDGPQKPKKRRARKRPRRYRTSPRRAIARWLSRLGKWEVGFLMLVLSPLFLLAAVIGLVAALLGPALRVAVRRDRKPRLKFRKSIRGAVRRELLDHALEAEAAKLIESVNEQADVRAVLVPNLFVGRPLAALRPPALVVFPDAVPMVFPSRFVGAFSKMDYTRLADSVRYASSLVCYSAHVANYQLKRFFADSIGNKPVHVIPQGFFSSLASAGEQNHGKSIEFKIFFPEYCEYIPNYDLSEIVYVVYPSVDRPHKNILTLLRAVEHLLRRHHQNIKVISTSHVVSRDTAEFVCHHKLFLDVLFTGSLDEERLTELIRRAALVVHPSLSEGGDVFNFSRAVANGVPALIADTAVVREMFERYGFSESVYGSWLFPPTDYMHLSVLIRRSLQERAALYKAQAALLQSVSAYDYTAMARRYLDAYEQAAANGGGRA